jgi:hypothetical protein
MMSVFKVRDAFLALTYEQQAMIVEEWNECYAVEAAVVSYAPKASGRIKFTASQTIKIRKAIRNGKSPDEIASSMAAAFPGERTYEAWKTMAYELRKQIQREGGK